MIHTAIADAGSAPEQTIMIGDTSYDMLMAKSASVEGIGVAWGYHDDDILFENGASKVMQSYGELPGLVKNMIG